MANGIFRATALGSAAFGSLWTVASAVDAQTLEWTGFYVGVTAGALGGQGGTSLDYDTPQPISGVLFIDNAPRTANTGGALDDLATAIGPLTPWPTSFDGGAALGFGAHAGYNRQAGNIVFGIEADASILGGSSSSFHAEDSFFTDPDNNGSRISDLSVSAGVETLFTLRPRIGVTTGRSLFYATGGLAFGRASLSTSASLAEAYVDSGKSSNATTEWEGSADAWRTGFAIGGGAEFKASERLTLRAEALYYDLGTLGVTALGTSTNASAVQSYRAEMDMSGIVGRIGFSYRL
jgi:outer membrane immunogenic protein